MNVRSGPELSEPLRLALGRYLTTVADDELVIGYRDSEWTAAAPMVEEDVAFSSLAQDEIGHARLYYTLAGELLGEDPDRLALLRPEDQYWHAPVLEEPAAPRYDPSGNHRAGGSWAKAVVRRYLYDLFDDLRTELLLAVRYPPLTGAVEKIRREEQYHLRHGAAWFEMLGNGAGDAHERLQTALSDSWPGLLGLFEPPKGEAALIDAGVVPGSWNLLRDGWLGLVRDRCRASGLHLPETGVEPETGGRLGVHGSGWVELYHDMTMVRRLEPDAAW
ncbi:MAG TPA: 1,2-phenylacetyl-CoA epoxidase subunit PaaC [Thermomicrobiaceae bacterium]|nr:1,2-phenylacetyl-CoA epoxidase subunit PaaC [Thermomicrobiaceae bacterium]